MRGFFVTFIAALGLAFLPGGCTHGEPEGERTLLSIQSESSVDTLRVLARVSEGGFTLDEHLEVSPLRDLNAEPLGVDLALISGAEAETLIQVSGYMEGALVALRHLRLSPSARGVIPLTLEAVSAECDLDGDAALDCDRAGCCPDAHFEAAFGDCAPEDPERFPGLKERCNEVDDDCDERIDEGVCLPASDALAEADAQADDVALGDLGPSVDVPLAEMDTSDSEGVDDVMAGADVTDDAEVHSDVALSDSVDEATDTDEDAGDEGDGEGPECVPACEGKDCGGDGCGGLCGSCGANESCTAGLCACVPACEGKTCGDDGCGGSCGLCASGESCVEGGCVCVPTCTAPGCDTSCDGVDDDCDGTPDDACDADQDGVIDLLEPEGCRLSPAEALVDSKGCMLGDLTQDGCVTDDEMGFLVNYIYLEPPDPELCPFKDEAIALDVSDFAKMNTNIGLQGECQATKSLCETGCAPFLCQGVGCGEDLCGVSCGGCEEGLQCVNGTCTCDPFCAPWESCTEGVCALEPQYGSCADIHASNPEWPDGVYLVDLDGVGELEPFEVYCDMTMAEGGWTLIAVFSDDGVDSWTWNERAKMGNSSALFGSLEARHSDLKSKAYNTLLFQSALFVHSTPSVPEDPIWAQYDLDQAAQSFGAFIAASPENKYYPPATGILMSAGNLVDPDPEGLGAGPGLKELCDTSLYINPCGQDGEGGCSGSKNAYGPTWSHSNGEGCPLDDPGISGGLGPCSGSAVSVEYSLDGPPSVGFGGVLGLNTGVEGSGENHMSLYVR